MTVVADEIRVAIVDDEELWSRVIAATLRDHGYTVAWIASTFESAVTKLNTKDYDLVLLDITLQTNHSGIELGKMLSTYYNKPFIFVTSNLEAETISAAVQAKPAAYLTKPFQAASLIGTLQSAINNSLYTTKATDKPDDDLFFVKQGKKYKKIRWSEVSWLRSDDNYTTIFNTADTLEYCIRSSLIRTMQHFIPAALQGEFIQVNRSEAVNFKYIQEVCNDEIRVAGKICSLTRTFSSDLRKKMNIIE